MTRVAKLAFGVLSVAAIAIVSVCNGQTPKDGGPAYNDAKVDLSSDGTTITVSPLIALVSRSAQAKTPFQWVIGKLPDGYTLEIDIRVQGGHKGPFKRPGTAPMGRYSGGSGATLPAGALVGEGREVWKYEVVLRDRDGNDHAAIDPMIVIME